MQLPLVVQVASVGPPIKPPNINSANAAAVLIVDCNDGIQRFCKGNSVNPYAAANEWVCATLAKHAGFSITSPAIVDIGGVLYFGTPYLDSTRATFSLGGPGNPAFLRSVNKDTILYEAIALDAFTINPDRHQGNLIAYADSATARSAWRVSLHDQDRALFGAPNLRLHGDARLSHYNGDPHDGWTLHESAWIRTDSPWYAGITDWAKLRASVDILARIPAPAIRSTIQAIPVQWLSARSRVLLYRFLLKRQWYLGRIVENRKGMFPNV